MPRNTELEAFRRPVKVEVTNSVTQAKPTLHPDAIVPVGNYASYETIGALNVAVPSGATGIMMQMHNDVNNPTYDDVVYWMFNTTNVPMTAPDQGFILASEGVKFVFWFDPDSTTYFNFWLGSSDVELYYKFVKRSTL